MTRDEFKKLVVVITRLYPDRPFYPAKDKNIFDEWYLQFQKEGITFELMLRAVRRYAGKNIHPPTIADLKQTGKEIYLEDKDKEEYRKWMT